MIIQTGMRTDIPAFFSEWFANRLRAGFVCTRNPYFPEQVTRYSLSPDVVDAIAFCTKNPAPMLQHMDLLMPSGRPYGQYWFVTITPYGKELEPNVPPKEEVMQTFKTLSKIVGANAMGWRYDPIIINQNYSVEWHIENFEKMAAILEGSTTSCVISFLEMYKKVERNFPEAREVTQNEREQIGKAFVQIAKNHGMVLRPCAEGNDLSKFGAECSGCMTRKTFEDALGEKLNAPKIKSQRPECACLLGKDIGQYDTCGHLCKYCYANSNATLVMKNMKLHNPASPLLVGELTPQDKIHDAAQKSWRAVEQQPMLF